jgi:phosphoglycolate phosphatase
VRSLLVLWDIDYTLMTSGGFGEQVYGLVFREMFGRDLPGLVSVAGRTDRAIIADTLALAGIEEPARHVDAFVAGLAAQAPLVRELAVTRCTALPGALAAVKALAAASEDLWIAQSVLTGNTRALAEVKLATLGFTSFFDLDVGAYGDHHEVRAELVHLARKRAAGVYGRDFTGQATVLIGDTPLDVAAALATGARVVGVATGGSPAAELAAAGAHAVLTDLSETAAVLAAIAG